MKLRKGTVVSLAGALAGWGMSVPAEGFRDVRERLKDHDWLTRGLLAPGPAGATSRPSTLADPASSRPGITSTVASLASSVATFFDGEFTYHPTIMAGSVAGVPTGDQPADRVDPNASASPYYGVASVSIGSGLCSGFAIGPNHVLTSGHCVDADPNAGTTAVSPTTVSVRFNGNAAVTRAVSAITIHPSFPGFNTGFADDLAVLQLSSSLPGAVPTYPILPAGILDPTKDKFRIDFTGYGRSGEGSAGASLAESSTVKRVGANLVESGTPDTDLPASGLPEVFRFDFEPTLSGPVPGETPPHFGAGDDYDWYAGDPAFNVYSSSPSQFLSRTLGNDLESVHARGDSGAPAFVKDANGTLFVAGLLTFTGNGLSNGSLESDFGTIGGGIWLGGYEAWLESVTGVAFADRNDFSPVPEPLRAVGCTGTLLGVWALARRRRLGPPPRACRDVRTPAD